MTKKLYPVFPSLGVLSEAGNPASSRLILSAGAAEDKSRLEIVNDTGFTEEHDTTAITVDRITARMEFVTDGKTYRIREPRENDGLWLSKYKVELPVEAIRAFAVRGDNMDPEETLDAFATDDSPYIVGVVYTNGVGRWTRSNGEWTLLASDDDTYTDMDVVTIDPERADEFLSLYDDNFVSITDAEQYESAESDDDVESIVPDNNSDK